jgi:hypothetical protein
MRYGKTTVQFPMAALADESWSSQNPEKLSEMTIQPTVESYLAFFFDVCEVDYSNVVAEGSEVEFSSLGSSLVAG